jgi:transcriptional regulator with XRE-family HTH domain
MNRVPNIKLKTLLYKQGITQRQLAFGTEIDEGQISKAVKHNITTAEIRERIADFLDVNQSDIFDKRNY